MDPQSVARKFTKYWSVQDVAQAVSVLSDDCVLTMNIAETLLPFAGEKRGRAAVEAALYAILADWDYIEFDFSTLGVSGNVVRGRIDYVYRHRRTGADLAAASRLLITVCGDKICRLDEFHDAAMVEAFMRLAQSG